MLQVTHVRFSAVNVQENIYLKIKQQNYPDSKTILSIIKYDSFGLLRVVGSSGYFQLRSNSYPMLK